MKKAKINMKNEYRLLINYRLYLGAAASSYCPGAFPKSYHEGLATGTGFALGFSTTEIEKDLKEMVEKGCCSRLEKIYLQYSQQNMNHCPFINT